MKCIILNVSMFLTTLIWSMTYFDITAATSVSFHYKSNHDLI